MDCFVAEPVPGQREALIRVLLAMTASFTQRVDRVVFVATCLT
jgi:hypothetical protein